MGFSIYHKKPGRSIHGKRIHPGRPAPTFKTRAEAKKWFKKYGSGNLSKVSIKGTKRRKR
jgi:hypothetical protein|tara:strand:- start:287 stop:466 length:180 start_codon:yes stop_codon:yes gene_type:complete